MKSRVRALRRNMTDAERLLWRSLRDRQMGGWKFRRQHPIRPFIVDFVCVERKLIIEVDGGQHASKVQEDASRSGYLRNKGYRILRFWNNQVLKETEAVLDMILAALDDDTPSPRPSPPNLGERESKYFSIKRMNGREIP
ncbi:MAG: endonuclease domain-containing protein [Syntrophobacteria bacterium]